MKISRDKVLRFRWVLPDLLLSVTVEFWANRDPLLAHPPLTALKQISVRQNANFADGFLQILPLGRHPCHSLTLPINRGCKGLAPCKCKNYARHKKKWNEFHSTDLNQTSLQVKSLIR
jgi:hypothetical protein